MIGMHVEFCGSRSNCQVCNKFTILDTAITACDYGENNETAVKGMVSSWIAVPIYGHFMYSYT